MKLPAFQFYVGDWRKDPGVQSLGYHDRGIWFEMLCIMHESPERGKLILNGAKMPEDALARLLGLDNQILSNTLTTLLTYGVASLCEETGAIMSRRMVRDENLRKIRQQAGKMGGNPALLNQNQTTVLKQIETPSSSSSISSSDEKQNGSPVSIEKAIAYGSQIGASEQVVRNWFTIRERDEWMIHGSNGFPRPVRNWMADLATAKSWKVQDSGKSPNAKKPDGTHSSQVGLS